MDSVTKIETDHIKRVNKLFYLVGGLFVGLPILAGAMLYGDEEGIPVIVIAGFLAVPLGLFAYLAIDLASFDRRRIRLVLGLIGAICFFFLFRWCSSQLRSGSLQYPPGPTTASRPSAC